MSKGASVAFTGNFSTNANVASYYYQPTFDGAQLYFEYFSPYSVSLCYMSSCLSFDLFYVSPVQSCHMELLFVRSWHYVFVLSIISVRPSNVTVTLTT